MSWNESPVNVEILWLFASTRPELRKRYNKAWEHYEITKAWVETPHVGQTLYHLHVKEGEFPNHHHYTIKFYVNHGKVKFGSI